MNKAIHFREELRNSFLFYALIPGAAFILIISMFSGIIWYQSVNRKATSDNLEICGIIEESIENYRRQALTARALCEPLMVADRTRLSETYSSLKEFVRKQTLSANFAVVDAHFNVLLQGDSAQTFRIPEYQKEIAWGPLQRMIQSPDQSVLEISRNYSSSGLDEIVIGAAAGENDMSLGFVLFMITEKSVQEALKDISSPYVITNSFRDVFSATNLYYLDSMNRLSSTYTASPGKVQVSGSNAIFRSDICGGQLSVYTIIDISQMRKATRTLVVLTVILLVILTGGMVISANRIAADKTRTIDELVNAFRQVETGNLENHVDIQGNVEFQTIGEAYNKLLDDIKRLIAENEKETKAKYLSELKQLEMQFNPHFLYNTLATIRYLIKLDPDGAVRTIVSLSELLRYSISSENSYVELEKDLKYIENYLAILETRFGRKFSFSINIADETQKAIIPKLIVQPVIENAVKYGFEGVERMSISVSAEKVTASSAEKGRQIEVDGDGGEFQQDCLCLTITDTGCGMMPEVFGQVRSLLENPENATDHIGLFNVQRRIRLLYGAEWGMSIESEPGKGTVVRIRLPFREEKGRFL